MAEGDSEPVFDFYCEFCNEEGLYKEAAGHCTDCDEYLCRSCVKMHKRLLSQHELLDKDTMPRATPPSSDRVRKDISTMCHQHKGEIVKYYCKTHDKLTCCKCYDKYHKSCTDVINITDINSMFNDKEYIDFKKKLKAIENQVRNISKKSRDLLAISKRCCSEAKQSVEQFRAEINSAEMISILDMLKTQADDVKYKDVLKIENIEKTCNTVQKMIDKMSSEFAGLESENRVRQAYIRIQQTRANIKDIEMQIKKAEDINTIIVFSFIPNDELSKNIEAFWKISVIGKEIKYDQTTSPVTITVSAASDWQNGNEQFYDEDNKINEDLDTSPVSDTVSKTDPVSNSPPATSTVSSYYCVQDIHVRSTSDEEACTISGLAVLSSKLVVIDSNNGRIKLIDKHCNRMISEFNVSWSPWDVTVIKQDQVAVTVYNKTILILKVTDTITLEREIKVSGECRGIVYSKNQLVVTYIHPSYIEIMDLYGNVSSKIENDKHGNKLFKWPLYVCASSDGDTLYVSDYNAHKVVSLRRDGSVKAVYTDTDLKYPAKVCLDHRGNVFVCGCSSRNIHMLTPDFTKIKVLPTQTDDLYSVSHSSLTDRLYVGFGKCDVVKVYQLS